jgi:hypothetical protein
MAVLATMLTGIFIACNNYETYGDLKKKERSAISEFISDSAFVIITETQFHDQGDVTHGSKEFVLLNKSGVYMQVERVGCGEKIKDGENLNLLCRFSEINIKEETVLTNAYYTPYEVDKMYVNRVGSTYTAWFVEGKMYETYGASVPEGWLVPLEYINVGRPVKADDEIAKVRLIVPHSQGTTSSAKANVYPCYYEITYQRER